MTKKRGSKKANQTENKLIYIPFVVLVVIVVLLVSLPYIHSPNSNSSTIANADTPFFNMMKVSNIDYAQNNSVQVYFISWYGCPNGATTSWPLYLALKKFGNLIVEPHYSINEPDLGSAIPGLLFLNYTPYSNYSNVYFHPIYIYGQYLNETINGTPITTNAVLYGLKELKALVPEWVYNLTVFYELNQTLPNLGKPIAYAGNPPHLVTILIISGPGGTWVDVGYPKNISPIDLMDLNATELYNIVVKNQVASGSYASAYKAILNAYKVVLNAIEQAKLEY